MYKLRLWYTRGLASITVQAAGICKGNQQRFKRWIFSEIFPAFLNFWGARLRDNFKELSGDWSFRSTFTLSVKNTHETMNYDYVAPIKGRTMKRCSMCSSSSPSRSLPQSTGQALVRILVFYEVDNDLHNFVGHNYSGTNILQGVVMNTKTRVWYNSPSVVRHHSCLF